MLTVCWFPKVDLCRLNQDLNSPNVNGMASYEPEISPRLLYKMTSPTNVTLGIFHSGKVRETVVIEYSAYGMSRCCAYKLHSRKIFVIV